MSAKGKIVPLLRHGQPRLLLIGEAPGPRGASLSGYPFWGDVSGKQIYALFGELGLLHEPPRLPERVAGRPVGQPPAGDYAVTNACQQMPWDETKGTFRAPTLAELAAQAPRLRREIDASQAPLVLAVGLPAVRSLELALACPLIPERGGLKETIEHCLAAGGVRCGERTLLATYHPSYGQWQRPGSGELHRRVVTLLAARIATCR